MQAVPSLFEVHLSLCHFVIYTSNKEHQCSDNSTIALLSSCDVFSISSMILMMIMPYSLEDQRQIKKLAAF